MADNYNFIDLYIGYPGHPSYKSSEIIEDDIIRVIVQKYEVLIFTNKGEVLGDPYFGANLVELLHETRLSSEVIEAEILAQIQEYIPELEGIDYSVKVEFFEDPDRYQEYMSVDFTVAGYQVSATVN
jgi:hypothetical protein